MGKLLSGIFSWIGWKVATFLIILAVLITGAWIQNELKSIETLEIERATLLAKKAKLAGDRSGYELVAKGKLDKVYKAQVDMVGR
jgi:hypothetical protein